MSGCLIACRSMTYAQRSAHALEEAGYTAHVMRMPAALSESGCGYTIKVSERYLAQITELLRTKGLTPKKAYVKGQDGVYAEIKI